MSATYKARKIETSLKKKGFERKNSHHKALVLKVDGKVTSVRTRISHSDPDYSGTILTAMRKQLGRLSADEFDKLIECPLKKPGYVNILVERGILGSEFQQARLE